LTTTRTGALTPPRHLLASFPSSSLLSDLPILSRYGTLATYRTRSTSSRSRWRMFGLFSSAFFLSLLSGV
jgi:hypothetical protein